MLGYRLLEGLFQQEAEHRKISGSRTYGRWSPPRRKSWPDMSDVWYKIPDWLAGGFILTCILLLADAMLWAFIALVKADASSKKVVIKAPAKVEATVAKRDYVYHYTLTKEEYEDLEYRRQLQLIDQQTADRIKNNRKDESK